MKQHRPSLTLHEREGRSGTLAPPALRSAVLRQHHAPAPQCLATPNRVRSIERGTAPLLRSTL